MSDEDAKDLQIVKIHFFSKNSNFSSPAKCRGCLALSVEVKIKIFAEKLENNIVYIGLIVYVKNFNQIISRFQKSMELDVAINLFFQF